MTTSASSVRLVRDTAPIPRRLPPVRPATWVRSDALRGATGVPATLVAETFQVTGSFKFRAAWNRARNARSGRLLAASSGNFGQALAAACRLLGREAFVVMPDATPIVKIEGVRARGGSVVLTDLSKESRAERLARLAADMPEAEVASAYDDPFVIAGNATLGVEIGRALGARSAGRNGRGRPGRAAVVAPISGGGLCSGIVEGLRAVGAQDVDVIGAEPAIANDAARSLRSGRLVGNDVEPATIADGARVRRLGDHPWAILRDSLAGIVEVSEARIAEGVRALFRLANLKAEPTGALAAGALLAEPDRFRGYRECVLVVSGGNVDPALYARLLSEEDDEGNREG